MSKITKEEVKRDIDRYAALETVANTKGGKLIINGLQRDIVAAIDSLQSGYEKMTETQLRALCAKFAERLNLYRSLIRSGKNKLDARKVLAEILQNDPDSQE